MITKEHVADLQPGDVVEIREEDCPDVVTRGPLHEAPNGALDLGGIYRVRAADGSARLASRYTLTVVSRAPRPLYVNSDRTEPVPGDVVRDAKGVIRFATVLNDEPAFWSYDYEPGWRWTWTTNPPKPLTLLVDGDTGEVVP